MFRDLNKYLDKIEDAAEATGSFLRKLNGARVRQRNAINKSEEQIKLMKNESKYVQSIKPSIIDDTRKISKDILYNNLVDALAINEEFDDAVYRGNLLEVVENNDTYMVRITGSGFNSKISVDINLDKTAGRLELWERAVKAARKELKIKVPRRGSKNFDSAARAASRAWAGIYSRKDAKYYNTIKKRLSFAVKPAPFWSIVNFGTIPFKSDRGGYPTPRNRNTGFVNKAEIEIQSATAGFFDTARGEFEELFEEYNKYLVEARERMTRLDNLAEEIRFDREVARKLERTLNLDRQEVDRDALSKAVEQVRKGLLAKGKINIGRRNRKYLSVRRIVEAL